MSEWIRAKDRLPKYGEVVLVVPIPDAGECVQAGVLTHTDYMGNHWNILVHLGNLVENIPEIDYWRPLPPLPEEDTTL